MLWLCCYGNHHFRICNKKLRNLLTTFMLFFFFFFGYSVEFPGRALERYSDTYAPIAMSHLDCGNPIFIFYNAPKRVLVVLDHHRSRV